MNSDDWTRLYKRAAPNGAVKPRFSRRDNTAPAGKEALPGTHDTFMCAGKPAVAGLTDPSPGFRSMAVKLSEAKKYYQPCKVCKPGE